MRYKFPDTIGDAFSARMQAKALLDLQNSEPLTDVFQLLYNIPGSPQQSLTLPYTDNYPMTWVMKTGDELHIIIRGSQTATHFESHRDTWRDTFQAYGNVWFTKYHFRGAELLYERLSNASILNGVTTIRMFGHSLGGATLFPLAEIIRFNKPDATINIHTIGSPKVVWRNHTRMSRGINVSRWFNDNDAVPNLVPNTGVSTFLDALLTPQQVINNNSWRNVDGGRQLSLNGEVNVMENSNALISSTVSDLAGWMSSWVVGTNQHSIAEYIRRLRLQEDIQDAGTTIPPISQPTNPDATAQQAQLITQEPVNTNPPSSLRPRLGQVIDEVIANQTATQQANSYNQANATSQIQQNPTKKVKTWYKIKSGNLYQIFNGKTQVGVSNSAYKANQVVMNGNQLDGWLKKIVKS